MDKKDELIAKLEELKPKITKGEWRPHRKWFTNNYAGFWTITNGYHYDSEDILNAENVGEPQAEANADLMVLAPVMMEYILSLKVEVEKEKLNNLDDLDTAANKPY